MFFRFFPASLKIGGAGGKGQGVDEGDQSLAALHGTNEDLC